jgi:ribose transport system permease protein
MQVKNEKLRSRLLGSNVATLIVVLIIVVAVFTVLKRSYLTADNAINIVYACCTVGLLAIGETFLIIGGHIDLSCAACGAASGVLVAILVTKLGVSWYAALLICIAMGAVVGVANSVLANVFNLQPFIATLAMASVCQGVGYLICDGRSVSLINKPLVTLGSGKIFDIIPIPVIVLLALYLIFAFVLNRTTFGRTIYVIGGNPMASRLAGLNPKKISSVLYVISGMIAALAGCLLAGRMHCGAPSSVLGSEFDAITAAVLGGVAFTGGRGTLGGCLIGLIIIQCFSNGLSYVGVSSFWQMIAKGLLLIGALLVDYFRSVRTAK